MSIFNRKSAGKARDARKTLKARSLRLESLENRELLSADPALADYEAIRANYPALDLPEWQADAAPINIIEIDAEKLSVETLNSNISSATTATGDDLIVVRTTNANNTITLSGSEIAIDYDANTYGKLYIVAYGDKPLTIDAADQSRVLSINYDDNSNSADVSLANMTLTNGDTSNSVDNYSYSGGGIYIEEGSKLTAVNLAVTGNNAGNGADGGGVSVISGATFNAVNVLFAENTASNTGGGVYNNGTFNGTNVTIAGNSASNDGGGVCNDNTANVYNSIITGNTVGNSQNDVYDVTSEGGAINLISASESPFVDGSYTLKSGSNAINAGDNAKLKSYEIDDVANYGEDLAGGSRVVGAAVDLGAYEYDPDQANSVTLNSVSLSNASPKLNDELTATVTASGDVEVTYQWYRVAATGEGSDTKIGTDSKTYTVTVDDIGAQLYVVATKIDDATKYVTSENATVRARHNAPSELSVVSKTDATVALSWSASDDEQVAGYRIEYSTDSSFATYGTRDAGNVLQYEVTGLSSNQEYYFRVVATGENSDSEPSTSKAVKTPITTKMKVDGVVDGAWHVGQTLTALAYTGTDVEVEGVTYSWYRDDASESFQMGNTYTPTKDADLNHTLKVVATIPDGYYAVEADLTASKTVGEACSTVVTTLDDDSTAIDGAISLREAIAYAKDGDTIKFADSLFTEGSSVATYTLKQGELTIDKSVTIEGADKITIDAQFKSRVFTVNNGASLTVNNLVIQNGSSDYSGGGVRNLGTFTANGATIQNCKSGQSGGGVNNLGTFTANDVTINSCSALEGGGVCNNNGIVLKFTDWRKTELASNPVYDGKFEATNLTITDCDATNNGGGVYNQGVFNATNLIVKGCSAAYGGGVCVDSNISATESGTTYSLPATFTATNALIVNNAANDDSGEDGYGGGVYVLAYDACEPGVFTAYNSTIANNTAVNGGGVYLGSKTNHKESFTKDVTVDGAKYKVQSESAYDLYLTAGKFEAYNSIIVGNTGGDVSKVDDGQYTYVGKYETNDEGVEELKTDFDLCGTVYTEKVGEVKGANNLSSYQTWTVEAGKLNIVYNNNISLFVTDGYALVFDENSQAIDQGDAGRLAESVTTDLAGNPRTVKGAVDLGAYEYYSVKLTDDNVTITNVSGTEIANAKVGDTLNATLPDGATATYVWYRDDEQISNETGDSYKITDEDVKEDNTGKTLKVVATGTDYAIGSGSVSATVCDRLTQPVVTVGDCTDKTISVSWDAVTDASTYKLERATNEDFSADLLTIYEGADVSFTTGNSESDTLAADTTYYFRVTALADDKSDSAYSTAATGTTKNSFTVTIAGEPSAEGVSQKIGDKLTASSKDGDSTVAATYAWYRVKDGTADPILNADNTAYAGTSYTITAADVGYTFKVEATGTSAGYEYTESASTSSAVVSALPKPVFSVDAKSDASISLTNNTELPSDVVNAKYTFEYSADKTSWNPVAVGEINELSRNTTYYFRAKVTADNYSDSEEFGEEDIKSATTEKTAITSVSISGTAGVGQTLTATAKFGDETATADFVWTRVDDDNVTTTKTGATYVLTDADCGCTLTVSATGTGDFKGTVDLAETDKVTINEAASTVVTTVKDDVNADDGVTSLREAIAVAAESGKTVTFASSLKGKTITLAKSLTINNSLSISGKGITVVGASNDRVFNIDGGTGSKISVSLTGLTITGGNTTGNGGGVYVANAKLWLTNATVTGNSAAQGAGVYATNATVYFSNTTVSSNRATSYGGGVYVDASTALFTRSYVKGNGAVDFGGGIYATNKSVVTLTRSEVTGNSITGASVEEAYAGIYKTGRSVVTQTRSTVNKNTATVKDNTTTEKIEGSEGVFGVASPTAKSAHAIYGPSAMPVSAVDAAFAQIDDLLNDVEIQLPF